MNVAPDATLDELRLALIARVAEAAVFDGWGASAVETAARAEGVDPQVARLALGADPVELVAAWIEATDVAMERAFADGSLASLSIRERIRRLVQFRLDRILGCEEALRRALAILAMPQNAMRTLRMGWASADRMWRLAGDTSTDASHYTRRVTLAAIYAATLAVYVDDASEAKAETRAFLARRIEGVIRFEKAKAQLLLPSEDRFSMARFLGRLRYPAH